jgi:hypothetical protein
VVVGTVVEDFLGAGTDTIDDPASFAAASPGLYEQTDQGYFCLWRYENRRRARGGEPMALLGCSFQRPQQ